MHNPSSGLQYLATAAHCSSDPNENYVNGITFTNGDRTQTIGSSVFVPGLHDVALIRTSSAGNEIYTGASVKAGDTHTAEPVVGQGGVSINESLCESGAVGGVSCDLIVEEIGVSPAWESFNSLTVAIPVDAVPHFTVPGDSGGPWFSLAGTGTVTARGITEGEANDDFGNPAEYFTPMTVLTHDTGAVVNT
jgi:hypothetical protein